VEQQEPFTVFVKTKLCKSTFHPLVDTDSAFNNCVIQKQFLISSFNRHEIPADDCYWK